MKPGETRQSIPKRCYQFFAERYPLQQFIDFIKHKEIPAGNHSRVWYFFGGMALFFFTIQIVTGILLLMYYKVGENTSYESLHYLIAHVPFGWLIRSMHCWSAHLMVISLVIHMFSVFFVKAYRKPREFTWLTGMTLFGCALGFGFSGYLLPWNELSFFATKVGTDIAKAVPFVGEWMREVMRGGPDVTGNTLYRFFALHVCILPLITFALIGLHLFFIQIQGMSTDPEESHGHAGAKKRKYPSMPFFPNFALRDAALWCVLFAGLLVLIFYLPYGPHIAGFEWELGEKADPLKPAYPGIKPEWYFLWMYQLLKLMPTHIGPMEGEQFGFMLSNLLLGIWALTPFLDRNAARNKPSPAWSDFGVAAVLFCLYMSLLAWDLSAATCAGVVIGLAFVINGCRFILLRSRAFPISVSVVLMAILHAFVFTPEWGKSNGMAGREFELVLYLCVPVCIGLVIASALRSKKEKTLK